MPKITVIPNNPSLLGMVDLRANKEFSQRGGKPLTMQIAKPMWPSDGAGFPLVVFIQGSSWTKPNQFWRIPHLSQLAQRGFVVASVTHRSCLEAPAPAFLQDVKCAIRYLRAHAEEYDIDKTRVCAWGTSSGGNAALLLGLTGDDPAFETDEWAGESSAVQAVVDCFGPTDLMKMVQVQYKDVPLEKGDLAQVMTGLGGALELAGTISREEMCEAIRARLELISPIRYVEPGRTLPPFLMLHGDADPVVLFEDTEEMYNRLLECGYEAELVRVVGAEHEGSFWSPTVNEIIFDFIQRKLQQSPAKV